jgi:putative nucleotidyltransferase with HDIG domain
MPRSHVLFVDGDADLLQGLRDALRRRRREWDLTFVATAEEALQVLAAQPCDILVTEWRLPQMAGAELLSTAAQHFPAVSRVMLTGQTERQPMLLAHQLAHQTLTKPCATADLQTVLERLLLARERASSQKVRALVGRVTQLPTVTWVHNELLRALRQEACRVDDLAAIVERDPSLTTKVLQLANSICFGEHERLRSVLAATRYLGLEHLAALVMLAQTLQLVDQLPAGHPFDVTRWQRHSMACAALARQRCVEPDHADEAYLAGLLHDLGHVVFRLVCADEWAEILRRHALKEWSVQDGERSVLGVGHAEVGAHLLACWGFEPALVAAVARHHGHAGLLGEALPSPGMQAVIQATRQAQWILDGMDHLPPADDPLRAWLLARTSPDAHDVSRLDELITLLRQPVQAQ